MKTEFNPCTLKRVLTATGPIKSATFTVESVATGKDFTFKIWRKEMAPGVLKTMVAVERRYMEFLYLGVYDNGGISYKGQPVESQSAKGAAWIINKVTKCESLAGKAKFYHLGKCLVCGRTLTDAESIKIGIGPKCRGN